ncbi:MAG TPA: class I SAM-dependent methyltransferase [Thermoanaerobaculia bacterium]|nr:class I SAM-dependent methyltransferase [Thermoanaerobaculia bacterium]
MTSPPQLAVAPAETAAAPRPHVVVRGFLRLLERNFLPDALIRLGIRKLCAERLAAETAGGRDAIEGRKRELIARLRASAVAVHTGEANAQHYELPTAFFRRVLGRRLKYSGAYWPAGVDSLDRAEEAMLALTAERAEIADGQSILDLGCGWGSFTLWAAERFPSARILAVSNSSTQKVFIEEQARERGFANVTVRTVDANVLGTEAAPEELRAADLASRFDRIVSVEMLEHVRNYEEMLGRIAAWLTPEGKLFVHVFCHREVAYPFEVKDESDWMARFFFTGGLMPSADLLPRFVKPTGKVSLVVEAQWLVDGTHYQKTAEAWLANQDHFSRELKPLIAEVYGSDNATRWWVYWRVFFMACAELFGYAEGGEWQVAHYRFGQD